jgi:hypothetical protein
MRYQLLVKCVPRRRASTLARIKPSPALYNSVVTKCAA